MTTGMEKIRVFICFELPTEVSHSVRDLIHYLKTFGRGVRWVHHDGIHLTLKFLGEIDSQRIKDVAAVVEKVAKNYAPFALKLAGKGAFPDFKRPRVFWIGIRETADTIHRIQQDLENELETVGFPKDKRQFSPHLTLGRVKFNDPTVHKIALELERMHVEEIEFSMDHIVIMKSDLHPNGAIYTPLRKIKMSRDDLRG